MSSLRASKIRSPNAFSFIDCVALANENEHNVLLLNYQVDEQVKVLRERGLSAAGISCHQGSMGERDALIKFAVTTYGKIDCVILCVGVQPGYCKQNFETMIVSGIFVRASK